MSTSKKVTFPRKLWKLVNDCRLASAIRWTEEAQSFLLYENQLRDLCLGKENKVFYTRQPKSFIRQLHLYGFRKLSRNQFKHPYFIRDRPHLLDGIKRSYRNVNPEPQEHQQPQLITQQDSEIDQTIVNANLNNSNSSGSEINDVYYNEPVNIINDTTYTNLDGYNYNSYYMTTANNNIGFGEYATIQDPTLPSICSLCVCPGCCSSN